jgi:hypothetical protein
MPVNLRVVSYGGGVQSTAMLVLAAQRDRGFLRAFGEDSAAPPTFLFANVGDDSEHPATLTFVREVAVPYAADHGIELHILDRRKRDGSVETLWGRMMREGSRSLPIPVRMSNGAPGRRSCTADFKIKVTGKWLKAHGATATSPATVAIGISVDEATRANNRRREPHEKIVYPLLDLRLNRADCARVIRDAGMRVPPKSSCFFCPFHRLSAWTDMARDDPELFAKSVLLEDALNGRRDRLGKDHVFLTRLGAPLSHVVSADERPLFGWDDTDETAFECDSGRCWL